MSLTTQPTLESLQREVQQLQEQATGSAGPTCSPTGLSAAGFAGRGNSWLDRLICNSSTPAHNLAHFGEADYQVLDPRQPQIAAGGFVPGSAGNFYPDDFDLLLTARPSVHG